MKFYFYLHTHWDREWYFTNETVKVLLQNNIDQYLKNPSLPSFYLDGQISLVVDYLKNASVENRNKFLDLLKKKKIITGPWYSQPDVFNSLAETIIRNLQITKKISQDLQIPISKTMYCPDTFGFGNNLPQIFKLLGFNDFIFWRGINHKIESDYFIWEGIEKTKINCYCLRFGYFIMGSFIDWKLVSDGKIDQAINIFIKKFSNSIQEKHYLKMHQKYDLPVMIGVGHDQAPIYRNIYKFFQELNKKWEHKFEIKSHEDFFKELKIKKNKKTDLHKENLDYSFVSKIHRTIASTRYDFKKCFRDNELFLYHQLEPLQLWFKVNNLNYQNYKNQLWIQKICKMQAHDALGACVTDSVYLNNLNNLKQTLNEMQTEKDYIFRQISQNQNLGDNDLIIFNPMVNKNVESISVSKQTFNKKIEGYIKDKNYEIYILNSRKNELIFNDAYEADVILINQKIKPLNFQTIKTNQKIKKIKFEKITKNELKDYQNKYLLEVENDQGDTYDFDPCKNQETTILRPKNIEGQKINNLKIIKIKFYLEKINQEFKLTIFKTKEQEKLFIETISKIKNTKVSLLINCNENIKYENLFYEQTLSSKKAKNDDNIEWEKFKYLDKPVNAYRTNSFIKYKKNTVITYGTNEFWIKNNFIKITLYRSVDFLGKANLINRPGKISGLDSKKIKTDLAQMYQSKLEFEFSVYTKDKNNLNQIINSAYRKPMIFLLKSPDVEKDSLGQFIIETQKMTFNKKIKFPKNENLYVSSSWINYDNKLQMTLTNFQKEKINNLALNKTKILVNKKW